MQIPGDNNQIHFLYLFTIRIKFLINFRANVEFFDLIN